MVRVWIQTLQIQSNDPTSFNQTCERYYDRLIE